jgi:hypothetical protein
VGSRNEESQLHMCEFGWIMHAMLCIFMNQL